MECVINMALQITVKDRFFITGGQHYLQYVGLSMAKNWYMKFGKPLD